MHGRHGHPWRATTDRWQVLVAEVMLHQTQVTRVLGAWPAFVARFPDPATTAGAGLDAVLTAWGGLGYPRRARRLWEAAVHIRDRGWPDDLTELPGVGRYTAGAVRAEADGHDTVGVDVNIRRVVQRVHGRRLGLRAAEAAAVELASPLRGRDRLLALMDLGAAVCTARRPACERCPIAVSCAGRGPIAGEARRPTTPFAGSLRQRRGAILARLRAADLPLDAIDDREALHSLVDDGLAAVTGTRAHLAKA
jgi:A/G-specific adenine glycosylase